MDLTPFLESGKLLIRSAFMDTPFHANMIPEHLAKGALIIFDTFVRFFDGGDEQSALEARKFTEQMRRLVNLGATVLVMFHAPKGATAETLDLQAIRGSGELGAGLVHAFSLSMQGPTWRDNTLMRQVKNREHQCEPHTFEFTCDTATAICTFVGEASVALSKRNNKDAKTLAADATAQAFMNGHPGLTPREYERRCEEATGVRRSYKTFARWLSNGTGPDRTRDTNTRGGTYLP
jgi:triphosphoribosyl-dephospho-CoA synthetase